MLDTASTSAFWSDNNYYSIKSLKGGLEVRGVVIVGLGVSDFEVTYDSQLHRKPRKNKSGDYEVLLPCWERPPVLHTGCRFKVSRDINNRFGTIRKGDEVEVLCGSSGTESLYIYDIVSVATGLKVTHVYVNTRDVEITYMGDDSMYSKGMIPDYEDYKKSTHKNGIAGEMVRMIFR